MTPTPQEKQVLGWEKEKEALILRYQRLQDEADAVNAKIFEVCAQIEILNIKISTARGLPPAAPSSDEETE